MDCNSYSYINMEDNIYIIAECKSGLSGYPVIFERICNYFGDWFYYVYDLIADDCAEFNFSSLDYETQKTAYEKAARFYNTLVPEENAVPLF